MSAKVLVIDDSPVLVTLTVGALVQAGYHAEGVSDLTELDANLARAPADLILVDVNMPEMFGDDIVEFLKIQKKTKAKLILYSDIPESELKEKTTRSGADGYFSKARGIDSLIEEMRRFLNPKKRRVLIVDDSEMTVRLLEAELTAKGFEVFTADTAEKATKVILKKQTRPDLVLLDVRMPNVNGEQFCRFIKGNSLFSGIKVLLCSAEETEELERICREAGADGFVRKDAILSKVLAQALE